MTSIKEHKKRLEEKRKKLREEKRIIEELKVLKEKKSEDFLKRFNKYKIEDPVFYKKIVENIQVEEAADKPEEMVEGRVRSGVQDITVEEKESKSHKSDVWNWQLILIIFSFIVLITIIIIIFFVL
jgi:hypothetical protein